MDGLDLDIEESLPLSCPLALLTRLHTDLGPTFILTMAPVASDLTPREIGLSGFKYSDLDALAITQDKPSGKLVNWYNAQFYNGWGDASSPAGYRSIIGNGYQASRVVMGVLANPNDGGSGWYSISTYQSTLTALKGEFGDAFGCVVGWEYWDAGERDTPALMNYQWVKTLAGTVGLTGGDRSYGRNVSGGTVAPGVGQTPWPEYMSVRGG
jgi:hypothetical protein